MSALAVNTYCTEYGNKGVDLFNTGDYSGSIINLDEAISICPGKNLYYHKLRAISHMNLGHYGAAVKDFSIAIERNNTVDRSWEVCELLFRRGFAYEKLGLIERAENDYTSVLAIGLLDKNMHSMRTRLFSQIEVKKIKKESPTYFLIVANPRTGSTWLQLMLDSLPDVKSDFEFKYSNQDSLEFLADNTLYPNLTSNVLSPTYTEILNANIKGKIKGSKLIMDLNLQSLDLQTLRKLIDPNKVKIIHLVRNYQDIIESVSNGMYHVLDKKNVVPGMSNLQSVLISKNHIRKIQPGIKPIELKRNVLAQYLHNLFIVDVFF